MKPHEVVELLRQAHGYFEEAQLLPRQYARLIGLGRVINITGKVLDVLDTWDLDPYQKKYKLQSHASRLANCAAILVSRIVAPTATRFLPPLPPPPIENLKPAAQVEVDSAWDEFTRYGVEL